jgi:hypothetical protein
MMTSREKLEEAVDYYLGAEGGTVTPTAKDFIATLRHHGLKLQVIGADDDWKSRACRAENRLEAIADAVKGHLEEMAVMDNDD